MEIGSRQKKTRRMGCYIRNFILMEKMKKHYECKSIYKSEPPLIFDWDEEAGEISGPSANHFLEMRGQKTCPGHPMPISFPLSENPLRSKRDMAILIGFEYELPDDLKDYYPKWEPSEEELEAERQGHFIVY